MEKVNTCKRCSLTNEHPGIDLGKNGLCNLCNMDIPEVIFNNDLSIEASYQYYKNYKPDDENEYDCLLMLSGGKDSIYMLDKLLDENKFKVLAYTFATPFESHDAKDNIERVKNILEVEHYLDEDDNGYLTLMGHVFNNNFAEENSEYLDEKIPCILCSEFYILKACIYAKQKKIPFVLYCADPTQMVTFNSNLKFMAKYFTNHVGDEIAKKIFGDNISDFLEEKPENPIVIFPYVSMRDSYDRDKIISEVTQKGLYVTNPVKTHCHLFGMLNAHSFKHWDCLFYKLDYAANVRNGFLKKDDLKELESEMKRIIYDTATLGHLNESDRKSLYNLYGKMQYSDSTIEYLCEIIGKIQKTAKMLNVKLY